MSVSFVVFLSFIHSLAIYDVIITTLLLQLLGKICNFTINRDHINKNKGTKVVAYTCRYCSEPLNPNSAMLHTEI